MRPVFIENMQKNKMAKNGQLRLLAPVATAILFVLASPPWDWWPLALIALVPLIWALENTRPWEAFRIAWISGFFINLLACPWWASLFHRFADISWIMSGILTFLVCSYQGLSLGLFAWIARWSMRRTHLPWVFVAPLAIAFVEGVLPYLFQWHLGVAFWRAWPLVQVAELGGPVAVSSLLVLINAIFAGLLYGISKASVSRRALSVSIAFVIVALVLGILRAIQVDRIRENAPRIHIGMLQPNFGVVSAQERKLNGRRYVETLRNASRTLSEQNVDLIIWPESAWPYLFDRNLKQEYPTGHLWEMRNSNGKESLLFGTLSHDFGSHEVFNSVVLSDPNQRIVGHYDKIHRLPFGEYIPFEKHFPKFAEKIRNKLPERPDITKGASATVLRQDELVIAPLICSDELLPRHSKELTRAGGNLLVALTSDAWFGDSAAPYQHLAVASLRAIENRRDLVRVTNTGVSAHIDPIGRVLLESQLFDVPPNQPKQAITLHTEAALLDQSLVHLAFWHTGYLSPLCGLVLFICSNWRKTKKRK